jgi:hypothetical protein
MSFFRLMAVLVACESLWAGGVVRLKSRTIEVVAEWAPAAGRYWLVQFDRYPRREVRDELMRRGFRILNYVPDVALMVAAPNAPDLRGLGVTWAGPLRTVDKLSNLLARENTGAYLVVLHPGVEAAAAGRIARRQGFEMHDAEGLLPGHLLLTGNHHALAALAGHEEIAYILPAGPEMFTSKRVYGCPGPITEAGPVAEYSLAATGWPKDAQGRVALQYVFESMTRKLDSSIARSEVERALAEWARYSNVSFSPGTKAGQARSIDILFATGAHGDAFPFTSVAALAHTFYPAPPNAEPVAGNMHFNDAETWGVGNSIDLFSVALHEAGHALGLGHSDVPGAVMYPYYRISAGLTADDIAAVQLLYGTAGTGATSPAPPKGTTTPVAPPTSPPAGSDTVPPSVAIVSPGYTIVSTSAVSIAVSGTATDNVAVTSVKWSTSTGSGTAVGISAWSATIPLLMGTNSITVRANDAAGNSSWRSLTVVRN